MFNKFCTGPHAKTKFWCGFCKPPTVVVIHIEVKSDKLVSKILIQFVESFECSLAGVFSSLNSLNEFVFLLWQTCWQCYGWWTWYISPIPVLFVFWKLIFWITQQEIAKVIVNANWMAWVPEGWWNKISTAFKFLVSSKFWWNILVHRSSNFLTIDPYRHSAALVNSPTTFFEKG